MSRGANRPAGLPDCASEDVSTEASPKAATIINARRGDLSRDRDMAEAAPWWNRCIRLMTRGLILTRAHARRKGPGDSRTPVDRQLHGVAIWVRGVGRTRPRAAAAAK